MALRLSVPELGLTLAGRSEECRLRCGGLTLRAEDGAQQDLSVQLESIASSITGRDGGASSASAGMESITLRLSRAGGSSGPSADAAAATVVARYAWCVVGDQASLQPSQVAQLAVGSRAAAAAPAVKLDATSTSEKLDVHLSVGAGRLRFPRDLCACSQTAQAVESLDSELRALLPAVASGGEPAQAEAPSGSTIGRAFALQCPSVVLELPLTAVSWVEPHALLRAEDMRVSLRHDGAGASACDAHLGSVKLARVESSPGENPSKHTVALLALRAPLTVRLSDSEAERSVHVGSLDADFFIDQVAGLLGVVQAAQRLGSALPAAAGAAEAPAAEERPSPRTEVKVERVGVRLRASSRSGPQQAAEGLASLLIARIELALASTPPAPKAEEEAEAEAPAFKTETISLRFDSLAARFPAGGGSAPHGFSLELGWASEGGGQREAERRVRLDTVEREGIYLVEAVLPRVRVSACPSRAREVVPSLGPLLRALDGVDLVALLSQPSDDPMTVDVRLEQFDAVLLDEARQGPCVSAAVELRYKAQGGLTTPSRETVYLAVRPCSVSWLVAAKSTTAVVLCPSDIDVRWRLDPRGEVATVVASEVQLQVSLTQLLCVGRLLDEAAGLAKLASASKLASGSSPALRAHSPPEKATEQADNQSDADTEEFFDAREEETEAAEAAHGAGRAEVAKASSAPPAAAAPSRSLELRLSSVLATLLDDSDGPGAPLAQAMLRADDPFEARTLGEGGRLGASAWVSLYMYRRDGSRRDEPQGWEPLVELCLVEVELDLGRRALDLGVRGNLEFHVSTSMVAAALALSHRLPAVMDAGTGPRQATAFAPFQLHNATGTPLSFTPLSLAAEGQPAEEELPPGETASLASAGLLVSFPGFQPLELQPPFRERYRLWFGHASRASQIVNVLAESGKRGVTTLVTLHSTIVLHNTCADEVKLRLCRRDAQAIASLPLAIALGQRMPVPLEFQCGWLQSSAAADAADPRDKAEPRDRLELTAASLQALRGGGQGRMHWGGEGRACHLLTVDRLDTPRHGWQVCFHAPIVVHNGLLCDLEFELSEVVASSGRAGAAGESSSAGKGGAVRRARLGRGKSLSIYAACAKGFYLRARCLGYQWSLPIGVQMRAGQQEERVDERALRCPGEAQPSGSAGAKDSAQSASSSLALRVLLSYARGGMEAGACSRLRSTDGVSLHHSYPVSGGGLLLVLDQERAWRGRALPAARLGRGPDRAPRPRRGSSPGARRAPRPGAGDHGRSRQHAAAARRRPAEAAARAALARPLRLGGAGRRGRRRVHGLHLDGRPDQHG